MRQVPLPSASRLYWAALLFAVGLLPRLYQLTYHSLWLDEAISISWARLPARLIIAMGLELMQDKHPPLYYLLLHYWTSAFGEGETAVRLLSVLVGALTVPLGYLLLRELYGHWAGLVGGVLLAFNPFLVWYSQEVRMFGLATTLLLAAALCLVSALQGGGWWRWTAFVVCATASFYSYLLSALVLVAFGVYVLASWLRWRPMRRQRIAVAISFVSVGVLCAPLAWQAWQVGHSEAQGGVPFSDLPGQIHGLLRAFLMWKAPWQGPWVTATIVLLGGLAVLGAVIKLHAAYGKARPSFVAAVLLVPWLAANALLLADRTVFDEPRYLIFSATAVCLALARPIGAGRPNIRSFGWVGSALALIIFIGALGYQWTPSAQREQWRATARYLEAQAGSQDTVLLHADYVNRPFLYYYRGQANVTYPFAGAIESEQQITPLLSEVARHPAVWLVRSHWEVPDPQGLLDRWFAARYPLITEQYPAGITLKGYATDFRLPALPAEATPLDAVFNSSLRLVGYQLHGSPFKARDELFHPPSGWVHVTLYWQALQPVETPVEPVLHVTDNLGQIWGDRLDRPNGAMHMFPPQTWATGQIIRDDYDINLNPVTPTGKYRVEVGLQNSSGQLVPVKWNGQDTDRVVVQTIEIVPQ